MTSGISFSIMEIYLIHQMSRSSKDYGLYLIDKLLSHSRKRLQDWDSMPQIMEDWGAVFGNHLILEQQEYNLEEQAQLEAFEKITSAVSTRSGEIFFLQGPGGSGKTYLYNTLCCHLWSQNKIVLCVASSGIAALLLTGGQTAHSHFKIPIPCHESSFCSITKNSLLADLICITDYQW